MAGARRASGLFDAGWGEAFPLTRAEQKRYQEGAAIPDPFFAPPTTPHPSNYIEEKIARLRGTFGPTQFTTPKSYFKFCAPGGHGISCAGASSEISWFGGDRALSPLEVAQFRDAYCQSQQCQVPGSATPPAGFTEHVVTWKPRNPAVAVKASCQPVPAVAPVIMDVPLPPQPAGAPAPAPTYITVGCPPDHRWAFGLTGCVCVKIDAPYPLANIADIIDRCLIT